MEVVYAVDTLSVGLPQGGSIMVRAGTHWPKTDAIVKAHPWLFSDDPTVGLSMSEPVPVVVEQATAAPGELRQTRRLP
jgi:hypothetical protein